MEAESVVAAEGPSAAGAELQLAQDGAEGGILGKLVLVNPEPASAGGTKNVPSLKGLEFVMGTLTQDFALG